MSENKRHRMVDFWSERAKRFGPDMRANTNDIWLREVEIKYVHDLIAAHPFRQILDFGCANGYSTLRLAQAYPERQFEGIDINPDMIAVAMSCNAELGLPNLRFAERNVLAEAPRDGFDFIYAIRVFQNMESEELQKQAFDRLADTLEPGGHLLTIESYAQGYQELNDDRKRLDLSPLPIHEHLTLLTDAFDRHAAARLQPVGRVSLSSTYYLVTRLLYSAMAKQAGEPIDYDHPIHRIGALLPQIGEYGPQRACLYRKI